MVEARRGAPLRAPSLSYRRGAALPRLTPLLRALLLPALEVPGRALREEDLGEEDLGEEDLAGRPVFEPDFGAARRSFGIGSRA